MIQRPQKTQIPILKLNHFRIKMSYSKDQVCIFTTSAEHEAYLVQDNLLMANVDVILLNKKDSSYGTFGQIELYVPVLQAEKAKLILKQMHE